MTPELQTRREMVKSLARGHQEWQATATVTATMTAQKRQMLQVATTMPRQQPQQGT
jgi:hypothetical protein